MNSSIETHISSRALPVDEPIQVTQQRLLALLDEARALVAEDPFLGLGTLERFKVPLQDALGLQFVLKIQRLNSLRPVAMAFQQRQARPA